MDDSNKDNGQRSDELKALVATAVKDALAASVQQPPQLAAKQSVWVVIIGRITDPTSILSLVGLAAVAALGFGIYQSGGRLLESLQHTEIARGLITFLIAVATVSIAIIIALFAVLSSDSTVAKERFPMAKEVLTLLIGILGTILGFYFGSADKSGSTLDLGDIQISQQQLFTRVSGGLKPYRYSITSSDTTFQVVQAITDDGWIIQVMAKPLKAGSTITIDVVDSKDQRAVKKRDLAVPTASAQASDPAAQGAASSASSPTGVVSPAAVTASGAAK